VKNKPWAEHKTAPTPADMLRGAVAVLIEGIDQHKVAAMQGLNVGRVSEYVKPIEALVESLLKRSPNGNGDGEV
jgi:hypothetical protein